MRWSEVVSRDERGLNLQVTPWECGRHAQGNVGHIKACATNPVVTKEGEGLEQSRH
jgi:hypothetical protein